MSLCHWQRSSLRGNEHIAMRRRSPPSIRISPTQFTLNRAGFTLVEVLAATALALLMMGTVVSMFAIIGDSISGSRSTIELTERLRATQLTLQRDLAGITGGKIAPSRDPEQGYGYFEIIEGGLDAVVYAYQDGQPLSGGGPSGPVAITDEGLPDTSIGDMDDVIMFTTQSPGEPFVGRVETALVASGTVESQVAEVCWFLRGTTLYRRQLLVVPALQRQLARMMPPPGNKREKALGGFYARNDISVRMEGGDWDVRADAPSDPTLVLNSLGDLTKREHRYGHQPFAFPHDARGWGVLGLPTLRDCCAGNSRNEYWPFPFIPAGKYETWDEPYEGPGPSLPRTLIFPAGFGVGQVGGVREVKRVLFTDPQTDEDISPYGLNMWLESNPSLARYNITEFPNDTTRIADDIILTNVISFDVEVWDPGAPIYERMNDSEQLVSVMPGDHTYDLAVKEDIDTRTNANLNAGIGGDADYSLGGDYRLGPIAFGAFVDLNYMARLEQVDFPMKKNPMYAPPNYALDGSRAPAADFYDGGNIFSLLRGTRASGYVTGAPVQLWNLRASVYDTWSSHYEHDGKNQDAAPRSYAIDQERARVVDQGTNGLDDISVEVPPQSGNVFRINGADDMTEREAPPPYDAPLKAIRIKIRVFEPDSEQIREVTVVQDF